MQDKDIEKLIASDNFQEYLEDLKICCFPWQEIESPRFITFQGRFESDVRAFKERKDQGDYSYNFDYSERDLLRLLIDKLDSAKGVYFRMYRLFLIDKLNSYENYSVDENPHKRIFVEGKGYRFFIELQKVLVKKKTLYSDYSFIYKKLREDGYLHDITQLKFIEFLNENYGSEIDHKQLNLRETDTKNNVYYLLKKSF